MLFGLTDIGPIIITIVVGLIIMVTVFIVVSMFITAMMYKENPVRDRLMALKDNNDPTSSRSRKEVFDELKETLITFSGPISRKLYGKNIKFQKEAKAFLTEAGMPDSDIAVWRFLSVQVACAISLGAALFPISFLYTQSLSINVAALVFGLVIGRQLPQRILKAKAKKRKTEIKFKLPDALDLMVVCVEAGLGLDATISRVGEDIEAIAPEISYEFKRLNRELNAGISRMESFQNLGARAGVDELKALCALIVQSDKLGTSIAETLRIYADDMRVRRRQQAEELAAKASIKITFPLVLLIFPPLFIVLLGPSALNALKQFGMA